MPAMVDRAADMRAAMRERAFGLLPSGFIPRDCRRSATQASATLPCLAPPILGRKVGDRVHSAAVSAPDESDGPRLGTLPTRAERPPRPASPKADMAVLAPGHLLG